MAAMPPPAPPAPPPAGRNAFDGVYSGSMSLGASGESTLNANASGCQEERPATMKIVKGNVYIQYRNYKQRVLNYRGRVNSSGWVAAYHTNRDGSRSALSGQITNGVLTANMDRGPCNYTVTLTRS
jgi:hypothetical protein